MCTVYNNNYDMYVCSSKYADYILKILTKVVGVFSQTDIVVTAVGDSSQY